MSFSMETEIKNKLAFLNVEIIDKHAKFTITINCKPTFRGVYCNFYYFFDFCKR